jgi:uncharacterized surface protein with fasciclin (FAS1) repeats
MSNNVFQKSIAVTLGLAIASTGLLFSASSQAQNGTPAATPAKAPAMSQPSKAPVKKKPTIVDIASKGKEYSTLVTALKAADLVDTLAGDGPFTVFVPTNAAFAKLPKGTLANLLKPENKEQLKKILTYHVVSGAVPSTKLKNGQKVVTLEGSAISVQIKGGKVKVNNARVTAANVKATNGIIHVIDRVIMPPAAPTAPATKK